MVKKKPRGLNQFSEPLETFWRIPTPFRTARLQVLIFRNHSLFWNSIPFENSFWNCIYFENKNYREHCEWKDIVNCILGEKEYSLYVRDKLLRSFSSSANYNTFSSLSVFYWACDFAYYFGLSCRTSLLRPSMRGRPRLGVQWRLNARCCPNCRMLRVASRALRIDHDLGPRFPVARRAPRVDLDLRPRF